MKGKKQKSHIKDFSFEEAVYTKLEEYLSNIDHPGINDLYKTIIERVERPLIKLLLEKTDGNQVKVSRILGIHRNTLKKKIDSLKIKDKL